MSNIILFTVNLSHANYVKDLRIFPIEENLSRRERYTVQYSDWNLNHDTHTFSLHFASTLFNTSIFHPLPGPCPCLKLRFYNVLYSALKLYHNVKVDHNVLLLERGELLLFISMNVFTHLWHLLHRVENMMPLEITKWTVLFLFLIRYF